MKNKQNIISAPPQKNAKLASHANILFISLLDPKQIFFLFQNKELKDPNSDSVSVFFSIHTKF